MQRRRTQFNKEQFCLSFSNFKYLFLGGSGAVFKFGFRLHLKKTGSATLVLILSKSVLLLIQIRTLNLDPDLGFRPNLDPDPGLYYQF